MNPIKVSVIIVSYNAAHTIEACLHSLESQVCQTDSRAEVILVDSSTDTTAQIVAAHFPWVRLIVSLERKYPGDARNLGIAQAHGELLAFVDADCIVGESWLAEIIKAHNSDSLAIGGSVDNANPESYVGWGYYFCEFTRWAPQMPAGELVEAPTCALSIKRQAYERYGPFQEGAYCSDTHFNWRLGRAGHRPFFQPAVRVRHINLVNLKKFLLHEVEHGRAFGSLRVLEEDFSRLKSLVYGVGALLLPGLLLARVAQRVMLHNIYRDQFIRALPVVVLGLSAWSWGELLAYLSAARPTTVSTVSIVESVG
jgi:GT2 family glycosyltransferase